MNAILNCFFALFAGYQVVVQLGFVHLALLLFVLGLVVKLIVYVKSVTEAVQYDYL